MQVQVTNRNERGIALDIRTERGYEVLLDLVDGADVFLTNFRPNALTRRGIDPDTLRGRNPRLIYAVGTGFGPLGARRQPSGV